MLFDRPASLPIATVRAASPRAALMSYLRGIRNTTWRWTRPRVVPMMVAIVGMLAVLGSAEYLTHLARYTPQPPVVMIEPASFDQTPILIDGKPAPVGRMMQLPASSARVIVLSAP